MSLYTFINGQKKYIIKPFIVALYAWSRSGSSTPTTVYTKTSTPTAADNLYDENGQMTTYSISSVDTNYDNITVEIRDAVVFDRDSAKDIIP